jgi:hypothetical protein
MPHRRPVNSVRSTKRALLVLAVIGASAGMSSSLLAADRTTAQELFDEGKALMASGKVADACLKFDAAAQLSPTPGVRLNLADCWAKLGRAASALSKYDEALGLAERAGDGPAADLARERRAALLPRVAYLAVVVPEGAALPGLEISRDGEKIAEGKWATPMPVDPGEHEIVATAPGRRRWTTKETVTDAGGTLRVTLPVLAEEVSVAAQGEAHGQARIGNQRIVALASGGLGVLGVVAGTAFGVDAMEKKSDYKAHVGSNGQCVDAACQTLSHDAFVAGTWSTISFVASGALLATGAVLWFTAPKQGSPRIAPAVGYRTAVLTFAESW